MAQTTVIPPKKLEVFSELALDRIRKKLNGTADDGSPLPVARQVDELIREAVNPKNLALMYVGWLAYL
jgi:serine/threonine-protein kinase ATR